MIKRSNSNGFSKHMGREFQFPPHVFRKDCLSSEFVIPYHIRYTVDHHRYTENRHDEIYRSERLENHEESCYRNQYRYDIHADGDRHYLTRTYQRDDLRNTCQEENDT